MKVTAKLFATLRSYLPPGTTGNAFVQDIDAPATVGDLLRRWAIPDDMRLILFVNSVHATKDQVLGDGDVVAVFPPIAGG